MDTMEINKIVGAICGALLLYLGVQFFSNMIFFDAEHGGEHHYAYSLEVEEAGGGEPVEQVDFAIVMAEADPARGERIFNKCKACHNIDGTNATGPHLDGVVGREVASVPGFNYSGSLKPVADVWTPENMSHFLENPKGFAPGTAMGFAGLRAVEDRAAVIAYLKTTAQ